MVKLPDKCEWQNGFNPDNKGAWSGIQIGSRPIKAMVLGLEKGAQASLLGSIPRHSRLDDTSLRLV
jgi:hypothetical protein